MPLIDVADLDILDRAIDKMWEHRIIPEQLFAVLRNSPIVIHNRKSRTASHILLGFDHQGQCIAAPIVPTDDPLIWRPITAWYCKPSEAAILRQRRRR
jgi:hypothetical protein